MIKVSTYQNDAQGIDFSSLPSLFKEAHEWFVKAKPFYNESKIIKTVADRYIQELNEIAGGKSPKAVPKVNADNEAQEAIDFLEILLESATGSEKKEIEEAIEFIKLLS